MRLLSHPTKVWIDQPSVEVQVVQRLNQIIQAVDVPLIPGLRVAFPNHIDSSVSTMSRHCQTQVREFITHFPFLFSDFKVLALSDVAQHLAFIISKRHNRISCKKRRIHHKVWLVQKETCRCWLCYIGNNSACWAVASWLRRVDVTFSNELENLPRNWTRGRRAWRGLARFHRKWKGVSRCSWSGRRSSVHWN